MIRQCGQIPWAMWHREKGRFITDRILDLRWGALPTSSVIATQRQLAPSLIMMPGHVIMGMFGYASPAQMGNMAYLPCRNADSNEAFGKFERIN